MVLDELTFWTWFLVFVRCSAMMLASPIFGSNTINVRTRVGLAGAMSMALTFAVRHQVGAVPTEYVGMGITVLHEVLVGLVIGSFFQLVLQAIEMAGALADLQTGLSMSQTLNPVSGVPVTVIAQFKYMLGVVLFLNFGGHHAVVQALYGSFTMAPPGAAFSGPELHVNLVQLMQGFALLALQIAAPLSAVSFIVDAALGLVNRAVPSVPVFLVGLPAKLAVGLATLALMLPAVSAGVKAGVEHASAGLIRTLEAR